MSLFYKGYNNDGKKQTVPFIIGRVKEIVLENSVPTPNSPEPITTRKDIGRISFEVMFSSLNQSFSDSTTNFAYPMFSSIKNYPLLNEFVMIISGPDSNLNDGIDRASFYYMPPFSVWNFPNHGAFPRLDELQKYYDSISSKPGYNNSRNRNNPKTFSFPTIPMGSTFSEKQDVRGLKPYEGDIIVEGRFGQSIRLGSTNVDKQRPGVNLNPWSSDKSSPNSPITIIRNGQGNREEIDYQSLIDEDVNNDDSSIWLTSNQSVVFTALDFPLFSYGLGRPFYKPNTKIITKTDYNPPTDTVPARTLDT
jgi:hypothetical protein